MRASDVEEFSAFYAFDHPSELVDQICARYGGRFDTFCARDDDVGPVAFGAMIEQRPNVVTLMFFATDNFPIIAKKLTRFIVRALFPMYRKNGVHRIECVSMESHTATHRWLQVLGLKREGVMKGFGKNGETFHQFAWVSDAVC